jgi:hypothetical protein
MFSYVDFSNNEKLLNFISAIYRKFYTYLIFTREPLEDISEVKNKLEKAKLGQGRERGKTNKPLVNIKFRGPPAEDYIYPNGNIPKVVIINTFSGYQTFGKYNAFANFIKSDQAIKINIAGEGEWRDLAEYEFPAYKNIVVNHTENILSQYKGFDEFGVILPDNSFNIVKTTNIFENVDTRTKERGLACKSFHKLPLVEILLKYLPLLHPVTQYLECLVHGL